VIHKDFYISTKSAIAFDFS